MSRVGNHRSLVDDEQSVTIKVVVEIERACRTGERPLTVDLPVDSERLMAAVQRKDLSRTSCRGKEHHLLFHSCESLDDGAGKDCLARSG